MSLRPVLAVLAIFAFLALACNGGDAVPTAAPAQSQPGLTRAEVEEIAQAAVAAMPQPEAEPGLTRAEVEEIAQAAVPEAEPGLSRSEVEEIAQAVVAAMPQPEAEPGLSRSEVEEIAQAAMAAVPEAEPGLTRSEVEEIAQAVVAAMPEAEPGLTRSEVEEIVRAAMAEAAGSEPASCRLIQGEPGAQGEVELHVEVIADGLEIPWGLAILPSGDLLVTERPGRLRLVQDGEVVPEPVLEFGVSILPPLFGQPIAGSEGGLLGLLLHPEFDANRQFYIFYNIDNEDGVSVGRIERYALSDDGRSATLDRLIMDGLPAGLHHQGGRMRLGPDGMLYVGVGAYDPPEAQNPDVLAGKLLRMDLDGGIPSDNPDPDSYIFASGIRNTQGYDWFDDRHIVMVDHGPSGFELNMPDLAGFDELNVVTAGDNLGWPRVWGCETQEGLVSPVLVWENSVPPTGGIFYRGDLIPEFTGNFLFTTVGLVERFTGRRMDGRHLHRVVLDPDDPYTVLDREIYLQNDYGRLRTLVEGPDGYLYMMTSNCDNRGECPPEGDVILRIGPAR